MQLNKIHSVKTVDRVAAELGETVDRLHDLAIGMEPEDGVIWVYGTAEIEILAFTAHSTASGHPFHEHPAGRSMNIRPPS
jgi:hypothetical protein